MSQLSTHEFSRLKHRLAQARRAWKRTEVLSGAVVVLIEILGAVGLAVLADVLFVLNRLGRITLLGLVAIVTLSLLVRHVLKPLVRHISDAQLALYLEERNPEFEGALIAAVEFGADQSLMPRQKEIIAGVLREAVLRVERFDLSKALNFRRFRKYGFLAVVIVAVYLILGAMIPESVGHYMTRVVTPWRITPEERVAIELAEALKKPISITLSRADTRLLRGRAFDLEATLSRKPVEPVMFHFRAFGSIGDETTWKQLPMEAVERLNGYQFTLPDVNEDLRFFVASGTFKSTLHRLNVYDPILLQNTRLTFHYPTYVNRPDETITKAASPDVAVLEGTTVTVAFESNRPLKQGRLVWENGTETLLQPVATNAQAVATSFEVTKDTSYTYTLVDEDGQALDSPGSVTVRALPDSPPTIKLLTPELAISAHPLGEFLFSADIQDDIGIAGTDLVYSQGIDPTASGVRLPLGPDQQEILFMLETLSETAQPGEVIACYLECRDLKGQKAVSDLVMITVVPFDTWNTWAPPLPSGSGEAMAKVEAILKATWALHAQRDYLAPVEFKRLTAELANTMLEPGTKDLLKYVNLTEMKGEALEHATKAVALIERGHHDLAAQATALAIGDFRAAIAELALAGLTDVRAIPPPPPSAVSASQKMTMIESASQTQVSAGIADLVKEPEAMAEAGKNQADQLEEILNKQKELARQMEAMKHASASASGAADKQNAAQAAAQAGVASEAATKQNAAQAANQAKLAAAQQQLAAQAKEVAAAMSGNADAEAKMSAVSRDMFESGIALQDAESEKAVQKANMAIRELEELVIELKARSEDDFGRLLDGAERAARSMLKEQAAVRVKTQALAKEMGRKKPNAIQQRTLKILAAQQAQINADIEPFAKMLAQLRKLSEAGLVRPGTAKQLEEADLRMTRARVPQKVANATIELVASQPANAVSEQEKAEEGLEKVLEAIRIANDARAAGYEAELRRAKGEADRIVEALERVARGDASAAETAVDEAQRLARHLQQRDLTKGDEQSGKDAALLGKLAADAPVLQAALKKAPKDSDFALAAARLQSRLDADYQALLAAKKLFTSQREECPPQYRQLVNQYFETLSTSTSKETPEP